MQEHNVEVRIGIDDDAIVVTFTADPSEASAIRRSRPSHQADRSKPGGFPFLGWAITLSPIVTSFNLLVAAQARAGLGRGCAGAPARRNPPISFQLICLKSRLTNRASLRWGYCKCGPINEQCC